MAHITLETLQIFNILGTWIYKLIKKYYIVAGFLLFIDILSKSDMISVYDVILIALLSIRIIHKKLSTKTINSHSHYSNVIINKNTFKVKKNI